MATLTFLTPDGAENQFELAGELKVGREAGNDVVLPEGGLSRNHCRFYEDGGQIWVEDFNSSNGTFVDGQRIGEPTPLEAGQEILVANIQVQLSAAAAKTVTPRRQASGVRKAAGSSARTGQMPAVKRNGSTALAKRGTSGSSPARRGNSDEAEPGALAQPAARGTLKGMTGPWAGKRFALSKMVSVVGRVEGNEVVIDDDSVSRRHAEVRKSGPGYAVRDLNSANGTYVNGERVTEAPLRPGDVVKFGVVEFTYSGPSMGKGAAGGASANDPARKKRLMFIGGGVGALLLVAFMAHEALAPVPSANPNGPDNGGGGQQQATAPDATALLGMCRSFSDTDGNTLDWKRAVDACDNVLKVDPINADARKLKKLSEKELGQQKIFEHAHELYSVGQEESAMDEYDKVETDSYYFAQARNDYKKCAEQVKKRNGDACLKGDKAADFEKAWIACKTYEDLAVCMGMEDKYQKIFLELQKRYKGKDEWAQPVKYKRWICNQLVVNNDPRKDALKKMYPDDLGDAMVLFAKDPVSGRLAIMRFRDKGKDATKTNRILQYADELYSKHQGAYEKITSHNRDAAGKDIRQEIEADHAIMPKDQETDMVTQDRDTIANAYADQGKIYFQQQRFDKAFEECFKGYEFTRANLNINGCLADLETYAATLDIDSCEAATQIEHITRKDSLPHKHASEAKAKNKCP